MTDRQKYLIALVGLTETDFEKSDIVGDALTELAEMVSDQEQAILELADIIGG